MIERRQLLISGLGVAAAAAAAALIPRRREILLKTPTVAEVLPRKVGPWSTVEWPDLNSPETEGELARLLYNEIVQRVYRDESTGAELMLLAAYGRTQSDLQQLHRPEVCYPAVGLTITSTKALQLPIGGASLPTRKLVATTKDRDENILYWTRIGEFLPQSGGEQREARLSNSLHGVVSDGILMRCSIVGDRDASFQLLEAFVPALLAAVERSKRPVLIGSRLARQMTA